MSKIWFIYSYPYGKDGNSLGHHQQHHLLLLLVQGRNQKKKLMTEAMSMKNL